MHICSKYIFFSLALVFALSFAQNSEAQKVRKNQKGKAALNDKAKREAEYLFTEAQKYYILEDYAKAMSLFQKCLDLSPDNAAIYYKLGEISVQNDNLGEALKYAKKTLELNTSNKYYYLLTANIYTQRGEFKNASLLYEEMIGKIKGTEEYLFELAAIYLYQKRLDDALSAYNRAEQSFGVSEQSVFQKQKIYLQLNQLDQAIEEGEKLINIYPEEPSYVLALTDILIANRKTAEAVKLLENLLVSFPNNGQAKLRLADLFKNEGKFDKADELLASAFDDSTINSDIKVQVIAAYTYKISQARKKNAPNATLEQNTMELARKLIDLHPEEANAYAVQGDLFYAFNQKKEALANYEKTVELDESNFQVWQNILQLDSELNDNAAAIKHSEKALEIFPNQSVLYMYYGLALHQIKEYDESIAILEQGKRLANGNMAQVSVFNSLLGNAYHAVKEYDKSDNAYDAALLVNPNDYQTLNNYSYYLSLREEKLDLAEKMAAKVARANPSNTTYVDTYAWVLYAKGKFKEARKQLERILDQDDISAVHYEHYGDILFQLGDVDGAVEQWQRAKRMDDSLENIDKKIVDRKLHE